MSNKTKVIAVRFTEEHYKEIKKISKKQINPMSSIVRNFALQALSNSELKDNFEQTRLSYFD
jgi:hypothetical protein